MTVPRAQTIQPVKDDNFDIVIGLLDDNVNERRGGGYASDISTATSHWQMCTFDSSGVLR
jgi:hypothetical protein